jgi:hypothetical protein
VPDLLWVVAHTTQAVQPGWRFAGGDATKMLGDGLGSVVSYLSPDGTELSIVIETANSVANQTLQVKLEAALSKRTSLNVWRSVAGDVFRQQAPLKLAKGAGTLSVAPGSVVTLTTVSSISKKGGAELVVPPFGTFQQLLPHTDDFESYAQGTMPRFSMDMQ